jgi:hypothetical protein
MLASRAAIRFNRIVPRPSRSRRGVREALRRSLGMFEYSRWAALAAAFAMTTQGYGQDQPKKPAPPADQPSTVRPPDEGKPEVRRLDPSKPGRPDQPQAMQDVLNRYVGTWDVTVRTLEPGKTDDGAEENRGRVESLAVLGGRAIQMTAMGEARAGEKPEDGYQGMGMLSYNSVARRFESVWADNMGTGIVFMSGQFDEATKTMTMRGDRVDAKSGTTVMTREVTRWLSDTEYTSELFETATDGSEKQTMVFRYRKATDNKEGERRASQPDL